jgi:hypothetical protein
MTGFDPKSTLQSLKHGKEPRDLPRIYLIAIWHSVPVARKRQSQQYERNMQEIFDEFLKVCGNNSIRESFDSTRKPPTTISPHGLGCAPWEASPPKEKADVWLTRIVTAALVLPYFSEGEERGAEDRLEKVEKEFRSSVEDWLPDKFGEVFRNAKGLSLLALPKDESA